MTEREVEGSVQNDPVPQKGDHIKGRGRVLTFGLGGEVFDSLGQGGIGQREMQPGERQRIRQNLTVTRLEV